MRKIVFALLILSLNLAPLTHADSQNPGEIRTDRNINHALKDINSLCITINSNNDSDDEFFQKIKAQIEKTLIDANFSIITINQNKKPDTSSLSLNLKTIKLPDSQICAISSQITLQSKIYLMDKKTPIDADIWKTPAILKAVTSEQLNNQIKIVIFTQLHTFISQCHNANPDNVSYPKASIITNKFDNKKIFAPAITIKNDQNESFTIVGSKNSKIFHKSSCSSAKRINKNNLIEYNSRSQAVNKGKRPCKLCNP